MMRALLGQGAVYAGATILARGASVALLIVLPLFLSPTEYGVLSLILAISALVVSNAPMEVTQGLVRYFPTASDRAKRAYASAALYFSLLCFLLFSLVALTLSGPLNAVLFGSPRYEPAFRLGVILIALNGVYYFVQNQFRWEMRPWDYAAVSLVFSTLTFGLAWAFAARSPQALVGVLAGQIAAVTLAVLIGFWKLRRSFEPSFAVAKLAQMLRFSLPLVPAGLAMFISTYAGRFVLSEHATLADVGHFTFASQIASLVMLAIVGFQGAITPLIMKHHEEPATAAGLGRLVEVVSSLGLCLCLAFGLFAPEFIAYVGDPDYAASAPLVIILAPALFSSQLYFFLPGFLIAKKTTRQMWVAIAGAVVAIAANLVLTPRFGATGAAWATLLASLLFIGAWFAASQPLYRVPLRWGRLIALYAAALAVGIWTVRADLGGVMQTVLIKMAILAATFFVAAALQLVPVRDAIAVIRAARPATPSGSGEGG